MRSSNPAAAAEKPAVALNDKVTRIPESRDSLPLPLESSVGISAKPVGLGLKSLRVNSPEHKVKGAQTIERVKAERVFSLEELIAAWKAFTDEILANDLMVQSVFRMAELVMTGENQLEIRLPGSTQVLVFNEHRSVLGDFMRERYGIQGVELLGVKTAITDVAIEYQTDKQKYDIVVKEYPLLEEMRQRFKLRIDY
ncbi:MAG: hypothetical protein ACKOW8_12795 [Flavobacteriales bacterium]